MSCGTFPFPVPSAPTGLAYQNLTSQSILVSWGEPSTFNGIPGDYIISYTRVETSITVNVTSPVTSVTLSELEKYEEYVVVVYATSDKGAGDSSELLMVLTLEDGELVFMLSFTSSYIVKLCAIWNFCVCVCVVFVF